jgi:hypothetical protein
VGTLGTLINLFVLRTKQIAGKRLPPGEFLGALLGPVDLSTKEPVHGRSPVDYRQAIPLYPFKVFP